MKYRSFGKDGIEVSEVGLGCWQIGGNWAHVEEAVAKSILMAAYDSGVTFYDSADVYGNGRSEEIVGKFLKEVGRSEVFVATKIGRGEMYPDSYTEKGIRDGIENSLRRLGVDALDLIQTHCIPYDAMRSGEVYGWLGKLVDEGKIKRIGASVETVDEAMMLMESLSCLYSLQIIYNIFRQKPIESIFKKAAEQNIGIIARVPLASGVLSGKFTEKTVFAEDDHRNFNKDGAAFNVGETFAGVPFEKGIELARRINELKPAELSLAEMAIRWILDFEAVSTVIPGATRAEQIAANASVSGLPRLSDEIHQELRELYKEEIVQCVRGAY